MRSPQPRARPRGYCECEYTCGQALELPPPSAARADLFRVLDRRRSRRPERPLSLAELSTLLWYTVKEYSHRGESGAANYWEHRAMPSAGGCHPIDVLARRGTRWFRYSPRVHSLSPVRVQDREQIRQFDAAVALCVGSEPGRNSTVLWFAAQPGRTARRYRWPTSLVLRDAGVLIGGIVLVAEALRLNALPLGITGEPWLSRALDPCGVVEGVGGILVGG